MTQGSPFIKRIAKVEGLPVAGVLVLIYVALVFLAPMVFTRSEIYMSFLKTVPPYLICALGLTFVITAGEIDLSFPAVIVFAGWIFSWAFRNIASPIAPLIGLVLALGAGALVGFVNGLLVARIGVPSIMATLAAQFFWMGTTILLVNGRSYDLSAITTNWVHTLFVGKLFGVIPAQALWGLALAVLLWFILNRHKFGEAVMFIGDNPNVARVMGINVEKTKIKLFTFNGIIAGFAAVLLTLDLNYFWPTTGDGFLLPVMATVFVGGTSIAGGEGSIVGTFFGSYIIGSLQAGIVATGIGGYWTQLVEGIVMAASVTLNVSIGEGGRMAGITKAFRRWATPKKTAAPEESAKIDK